MADDSGGDDSCGNPIVEEEDDDGCLGLCRGPSEEEGDDDSNCEEEESEEALSDDDEDVQGEEVCSDEEEYGEDFIDGPCDEDDEEGDGEAEDLCEDTSSNDGQEGERKVADGSYISDSEEDESDSDDDSDYDSSSGTDSDDSDYDLQSLPASLAVVESLPEATLSEEEADCGCSVCKDDFTSGQSVNRLPCKHYFHGDCIRSWLAIRSTCPVCRYQLLTDDAKSLFTQAPQWWFQLQLAGQGGTHQV
jgi:hypothetical protein